VPPRILVVDDDPALLDFVRDALASEGEVFAAETTDDAIAIAKKHEISCFVSDVNVPSHNGFGYRDLIRAIPHYAKAPFIFLTGADEEYEIQVAEKIGEDKLLLKPSSAAELRRAVRVALGQSSLEKGPIPAAMDKILQRVVANKETGVLTAVAGTTLKRVVFHQGNVAFAASNDPREVIGQAFIRAGLIKEKDLQEAFGIRDASGSSSKTSPLGKILTALRKVTPEQCEKVFERKIRESVLDLFLWKGGMVEYVQGGLEDSDRPYPIALDLAAMRIEGLKRRVKWADVRKLLPDPSVKFEKKGGSWPKGFPKNEGDKVLARHLDAGRSMAEIMMELRGQDFAVGSRIAELVKAGVLIPSAAGGFNPSFESVTMDLDEALERLEEDSMEAEVEDASQPLSDTDPGLHPGTRVLPGTPPPAPHVEERLAEELPMLEAEPLDPEPLEVLFAEPLPPEPAPPPAPVPWPTPSQGGWGAPTPPPPAHAGWGQPAAGGWGAPQAPPAQQAPPPPMDLELSEEEIVEKGPGIAPRAAQPVPPPAASSTFHISTRPPAAVHRTVVPDVAPPPAQAPATVAVLTRALVLLRAGDYAGARTGLLDVLSNDPMNPLARQRLAEVEAALVAQSGLTPDRRVKLAIPLEQLVGRQIGPQDAFVLTRLAGAPNGMPIGDLVRICPLPEAEVLAVVQRHIASGVLAFA
jgi:DNA-binding response OmpR family regulator